ncbi:MAG: translation elongation factor Ts [Geminicoccaceae bacterium]
MAAISAGLVKELREKTGAGMMDCKKALSETEGDVEAATDWLRKKGLAAAAKKAGRATAEGLVGLITERRAGALVELNSETDFVARNENFQALVRKVTALAPAAGGDLARLSEVTVPDSGRSVSEEITNAISVIGENMSLRRTAVIEVEAGAVGGYVHGQVVPGMGKIGVIVGLKSIASDTAALADFGKQIAMHVAASNPQAVASDQLDQTVVDREMAIYADQARASGKPDNIIEKMVQGRLRKFYEEVVLLDQAFVIDGDKKVREAVDAKAKELGAPIEVTGFEKFVLGEGVEKEETDLASEVAQLAGS